MTKELPKKIIHHIEHNYNNITGVIILKNEKIVYENYFQGFNQNRAIHIASVTKSIFSILIGIAIDKGFIKNIDQSVLDFFPHYKAKRGEKTIQTITLRHLLSMTAPYKFKSEPYSKILSSDDWTESALDLLGGKHLTEDFKYTTLGIQILSGIITNATGKTTLDFANENLFVKLDIKCPENIEIENREKYFDFIKGNYADSYWVCDQKGRNTSGWGLALTTRDMAKFGLLYINKGKWQNKEIVSQEWIDESIMRHSKWGEFSYGYLWWIIGDTKDGCFAAIGDGGNIVYVDKKLNLVIGITSKFQPRAKDRIGLIKTCILPMLPNLSR